MLEVVVGVTLTALLGGLLVPIVKGFLDRRSERYSTSVALVETLAVSLWAYWQLALRVAYYGRQGQRGSEGLDLALRRWDSDASWQIGSDVQTQLSRSKRFLPQHAQDELVEAQQKVVDHLDHEIDRLRGAATPDAWRKLYESLRTETRPAIESLLASAAGDLNIGRQPIAVTIAGRMGSDHFFMELQRPSLGLSVTKITIDVLIKAQGSQPDRILQDSQHTYRFWFRRKITTRIPDQLLGTPDAWYRIRWCARRQPYEQRNGIPYRETQKRLRDATPPLSSG
jgi:hypothetical protein